MKSAPHIRFAGQITGVEGYIGNVATGLLAGQNIVRILNETPPLQLPETTMLGALTHYISHAAPKDFQPMKANFGIIPALPKKVKNRQQRKQAYVKRAIADMEESITELDEPYLAEFAIPELIFRQ